MSWQATAWAERQVTGHPSRKALLLVLANYADDKGYCFPSQETLAAGAELSLDTIQRQSRRLQELDLIKIERMPKRRGQWQGFCYYLNLSRETKPIVTRPQDAARSMLPSGHDVSAPTTEEDAARPHRTMRPGQAASSPLTGPHSLRHKPSLEPPIEYSTEPSRANARTAAVERLRAFQGRQEPTEVIQNRIAQRIGADGWLVLGALSDWRRERLTTQERRGELDDATLASAVAAARLARSPP